MYENMFGTYKETMAMLYSYRGKPLSQTEWMMLHEDVMKLQDHVYRCISVGLCHEVRFLLVVFNVV